jgi:NTP pyrophosphatase (non-canonical NTP hydrolase)
MTGTTVNGNLAGMLKAVEVVDTWLDSDVSPDYRAQPLAHDWARITKVCEEAGEVWRALSKETGENPRKGVCGTEDELLGELGDTVCAGLFAIQHRTKDTTRTLAIVATALAKARERAERSEGAGR